MPTAADHASSRQSTAPSGTSPPPSALERRTTSASNRAVVLVTEHRPGAPEPRLHLVEDEERAGAPAEALRALQIGGRLDTHASFALHRFDDQRRSVLLIERRLERRKITERQACEMVIVEKKGARRRIFAVAHKAALVWPWKPRSTVRMRRRPVRARAILMATSIASAPLFTKITWAIPATSPTSRRASALDASLSRGWVKLGAEMNAAARPSSPRETTGCAQTAGRHIAPTRRGSVPRARRRDSCPRRGRWSGRSRSAARGSVARDSTPCSPPARRTPSTRAHWGSSIPVDDAVTAPVRVRAARGSTRRTILVTCPAASSGVHQRADRGPVKPVRREQPSRHSVTIRIIVDPKCALARTLRGA